MDVAERGLDVLVPEHFLNILDSCSSIGGVSRPRMTEMVRSQPLNSRSITSQRDRVAHRSSEAMPCHSACSPWILASMIERE